MPCECSLILNIETVIVSNGMYARKVMTFIVRWVDFLVKLRYISLHLLSMDFNDFLMVGSGVGAPPPKSAPGELTSLQIAP